MAGNTPLNTVPPVRGIVFFAHGSRDPLWHAPIEAVARVLQQSHPDTHSTCAYLELTQPDLPTATQQLVAAGCGHLTILPMFLGTGRHARNDLPLLVETLRTQYPHVQFEIATAVGEDPRVTELLARIAMRYIA